MDYQSLFEQDIYDDYGYKRPPNLGGSYQGRSGGAKGNKSTFYTQEEEAKPWMQPVHQLQFKHFEVSLWFFLEFQKFADLPGSCVCSY